MARKILNEDFPGFENRLEFEVFSGNIAGLCYLLETNQVKLQQLRLTGELQRLFSEDESRDVLMSVFLFFFQKRDGMIRECFMMP